MKKSKNLAGVFFFCYLMLTFNPSGDIIIIIKKNNIILLEGIKKMKNAFKKIVTLILIVSMMLGVMSTTALAAADTSTSGSTGALIPDADEPIGGGIDTDWCEVTYDENGITVVLNPNVSALTGINRTELKAVLETLVEAVKAIVIGDVIDDMIGILPSNPDSGESGEGGESGESGSTESFDAMAVFENALNTFIREEYGNTEAEDYVNFLKDLMVEGEEDEETVFDRFTAYILRMMRTIVENTSISAGSLPDASTIEDNIIEIFETEIEKRIKAETEKYVLLYIDFLKGEAVTIPDEIKSLIDEQVKIYVEGKIDSYINAGFAAPVEPDDVDSVIADYLNEEIKKQVDTWLKDYADGKAIPADVKTFVDAKIKAWVTEVANSYRDNVTPENPGPIYDVAYGKINGIIDAKVDEYITDYLKNEAIDDSIATVVDSFLHTEAPEIIYTTYWQYKDANSTDLATEGSLWNTIHTNVREAAAPVILANNLGVMTSIDDAYRHFDSKKSTELRTLLGASFDTEAVNTITTEISHYTQADWVAVWNDLSEDTQSSMKAEIKQKIKDSESFKSTVHGLIVGYWVAAEGASSDEIATVEANKRAAVVELLALSNYNNILETLISDAKANYSDIISDKINDYLGDNTITTLANVVGGIEDQGALEILTEKIKAEANLRFDEIKAEAFVAVLEKTEGEVEERVRVCVEEFLVHYEELVAELKAAEEENEEGEGSGNAGNNIAIDDVFTHIQKVSVNGMDLYAKDVVNLNTLVDFIFTLPTFDEIKDMSNAEMQLDFDITIDTDFGSTDLGLLVKLGDGFNDVREYSALVSKFLKFDREEDGTIVFDLQIPEKFAELVLRAINSDRVPDSLKHKVFKLFTKTVEDAHAFINETTLDDLLKIFDYVDFSGLLDASFIGNTSGLTTAQIKAKIKLYEGYYNRIVSLINSAYRRLPADVLSLSITDFYLEDGTFGKSDSVQLDIKGLLAGASSQYATLISSFIADEELDITYDISVNFASIRRIEYIIDGETYSSGFLPTGADVVYFANVLEYKHFPVLKWLDEEGNECTTMPDRDVKLYAVLDKTAGLVGKLPEKLESVYNGEDVTIELDLTTGELPEGAVITYQWYKDGVLIEGATEDTLNVKYVADSGKYVCEVKLFINDELYGIIKTNECDVKIAKATINLEDYAWSPDSYIYSGEMQYVYLVDKDKNPLTFGAIYVNDDTYKNGAINVGEYTAKVVFDTNNFEILGTVDEFDWEILKATYDMSGVSFKDKTVPYSGTLHTIEITGTLPAGVTVSYDTQGFVNPGTYTITASFKGDTNNYNPIDDLTATLRILAFINNHKSYDSNGSLIVDISSTRGVLEIYDLNVKDVSTQYNYVTSEEIFGVGKVGYVVSAYDVYFTEDGTVQPQEDQFTVKMLMPASLDKTPDELIRVVYIDENGNVQDMQGTRQGDYIVFNTTHFSIYAIVEIGDAPIVPTVKDYSWIWKLVVAIVAVLLIALVIIIIIVKKRKAKGDGDNNDAAKPLPKAPTPPAEEPAPEAPVVEETVEDTPEPTPEEVVEETPEEPAPAVEEPTTEQAPEETLPVEEPVKPLVVLSPFDENGEPRAIDGEVVHVRYRTSFMSRLIQADTTLQDYYTAVKNALLSYKGVKARTSWNFESFNCGRLQCAKLNVKGSAFQVYLGLDPKEYNANKYHFVDVGDKPKLDKVPMLVKVKSERGLKYALELIEEMMKKFELEKIEIKPKDYHLPYESTEALAAKDLVKVILPAGVSLEEGVNLVKVDVGSMLNEVNNQDEDE